MALWKDSSATVKDPAKDSLKDAVKDPQKAPGRDPGAADLTPPAGFSNPVSPEVPTVPLPTIPEPRMNTMASAATPMRDSDTRRTESVLTSELTIEGKIEGTGNVRIAGKFKGEVNVEGNLVIEQGAAVTANVRARTISIAGQLEGNIESAVRVELLETGVLTGDVTADSLTVAAGSRMRGTANFGWTDKSTPKP